MRCVICGSRTITKYEIVQNAIKESGFDITEVVSGCANGVDSLGERWAKDNHLKLFQFPALWNLYGKAAGFRRNAEMVEFVSPPKCNNGCVIAAWDGQSWGRKTICTKLSL
jgi:hypothetical protein